MNTITTELAALLPCLAGALRRDNTTEGRGGVTPGSVVNTDVLHAMVTLHREVPDTTMAAAELLGEQWRSRRIVTCLVAIPRFADRMHGLSMAADAIALEDDVRAWLRLTKQALGLREADRPLGYKCPECREGALIVAGCERFIHRTREGLTVQQEDAGRIYCIACGYAWPTAQWPFLGRRLLEAS